MLRKAIAFILVLINLMGMNQLAFAADEKVGYVTATGLYIRKSPDTSAEALRCANNGERLIILQEEGDWYYVQYSGSVYGYAAKQYIMTESGSGGTSSGSAASSNESLPAKVKDLGNAPATSKKGDKGDHVKKLQQALVIMNYYTGSCDGIFGEGTEVAVKKFQQAHGLSDDGVAGPVTIRIMFNQDAENASSGDSGSGSGGTSSAGTELLDWFSGGKELIPKGAYFTIKDTRSRTTIRVRHLYGGNHLDAEPVNSEETAKLLSVYGGEWSWRRRPILVSYNGRIIAASMNGMPHGNQSIYDNNFDGQFCIHFLGSMTHGSESVDPDHQSCVKEAFKASW